MTQGKPLSFNDQTLADLKVIMQTLSNQLALQSSQFAALLTELQNVKGTKVQMFAVFMPAANIEYKWQIPFGCKKLTMQCRDSTDVYMATNRGCVAGPSDPYFTLKGGTAWDDQDLNIGNLADISTIYFGCASAGKVVEIITWS
jgi:hypothetical protein